jgi:hypothetical protein
MAKLDRQGNIKSPSATNATKILEVKQPEKPADIDDTELFTTEAIEPLAQEPVDPEPEAVAVIYDFSIHCATLSEAGMDMEIICAHCPFKKTVCNDTILMPTETQMIDIAHILMMDEGEEDTGDK